MIEAAGNLIQSDIKSVHAKEVYPSSLPMSDIHQANAFLSESLRLLLDVLLVGKKKDLKLCSLGQAIMQATRPKNLLAPLQLGIGVQMHSQSASKFLIETLNKAWIYT